MEKIADQIKALVQDEIRIFKTLKTVLEEERQCLADMDVNGLWKLTDQKNRLVAEVAEKRRRLLEHLEETEGTAHTNPGSFSLSRIIRDLPVTDRDKADLKSEATVLDILKQEVSQTASDNKGFVYEHLSVVNDIFATITGLSRREHYTPSGRIMTGKAERSLIKAKV